MIALALTNLTKRFVAGAGPCHAAVLAVSNAYLDVTTCEILGVAGPTGSGKSTLLLCAAGLLSPDTGAVRWFDRPGQDALRGRVIYLGTGTPISRAFQFMTPFGPPRLLLLDDPLRGIDGPSLGRLDRALGRLAGAGGSAVITARDPDALRPICSRIIAMRGGKLLHASARVARVAEPARRPYFSPMPEFRLYNTLTRAIEPFGPSDGKTVRIYTCGPTVYNPAHLGNFRTFLFADLLRRVLRRQGWAVKQVMNLTDVDDKIIKRASEQKKTITQVTEPVTEIFHTDRQYLRIEPAEVYPKATDYIPQMIALVQNLIKNGVAYVADDKSVYFAIDKFPSYGRLSRLDKREIKTGARVAQDDYSKENAQDFALWKSAKPEDEATGAAWESPWGRGRPGWHLECSAMAIDLLGETLDIHAGGIDLIFPHHEDEIAQSEASTGKPFSRFWCHGAFLLTDGAKMAKRLGNVTTVQGMREAKVPAAALRHFVFNTHYRKELNLSEEALDASMNAVRRVGDFADRLAAARGATPELATAAAEALSAFDDALADDLNAPNALAAFFTFITRANAELDRSTPGAEPAALKQAQDAFKSMNGILDIVPEKTGPDPELARWADERVAARQAARKRRDFAEADRIRNELADRGIVIEDSPAGTTWKLR